MATWGALAFKMLQDAKRGSRANGNGDKPGGLTRSFAVDPDPAIVPT